ncbi:12417_t:CDS:1, partial [Dentiscutata erythropus]
EIQMDSEDKNKDKFRKCKSRENETFEQREVRLARKHDRKRQRESTESAEQRKAHLAHNHE